MPTEEPRYSEREFRERMQQRGERIAAAVSTGMLIHQEGRTKAITKAAARLPDGRIAIQLEHFNAVLADLGRVASAAYLEAVLRAVFDDDVA